MATVRDAMTPAQRALLQDLVDLGGIFSTFSPWEWRLLRHLQDLHLVERWPDSSYHVTALGRKALEKTLTV